MLHRVIEPYPLRPEVQAPMSSGTLASEWSLPSLLFWALYASQIRSLSRCWPNMSGFFHIFLSQKAIISSLHHALFWNLTTTLWSYCLFSLSGILSPVSLKINKGFWFLCSLLWGLQADIIAWFKTTKLLTSNQMIFLVEFGINKTLANFSKTTGSCNFS